ncbi:hypothetical protein [Thiocapsa sp.]|uniref:hypothetical protein n=1 Tax=Thiocapsa sp. TaxID=2024551 RepID=UPI0025F25E74|nr:hypothetical protein [Thiocapsa sp.]
MPDSAVSLHSGREPWRPNLVPLVTLMVCTCVLTTYFLVDTYLIRQPSVKYAENGTAFVLRLREPLDTSSQIKADGARLIQAIAEVKQQSDDLKSEIAERLTKDQAYQVELAAFMTQLEDAEKVIATLKEEVIGLQQDYARASGTDAKTAQRVKED